jgi:hypothetical protein
MADTGAYESDYSTDNESVSSLLSPEESFEEEEYSQLFPKDANGVPIMTFWDIIPTLPLATPDQLLDEVEFHSSHNPTNFSDIVYKGRNARRFKTKLSTSGRFTLGVGIKYAYTVSEQNDSLYLLGIPMEGVHSGPRQIPSRTGRVGIRPTPTRQPVQPVSLDCPPVLMELLAFSYNQDINHVPAEIWNSMEFPFMLFPREYIDLPSVPEKEGYARAVTDALKGELPISRLNIDQLRPRIHGYLLEPTTSKVLERIDAGEQIMTDVRDWNRLFGRGQDWFTESQTSFEYHFERNAWFHQEDGRTKPYRAPTSDGLQLRLNCVLPYQFYIVGSKYKLNELDENHRWIYSLMRKFQDWYRQGPAYQTNYQKSPILDERLLRYDIPPRYFDPNQ